MQRDQLIFQFQQANNFMTMSMMKQKKDAFQAQVQDLECLLVELQGKTLANKIQCLDKLEEVQLFLPLIHLLANEFKLSESDLFLLKSVAAIGQASVIFGSKNEAVVCEPILLKRFLQVLEDLENSYNTLGGIIGYHAMVLKLIDSMNLEDTALQEVVSYQEPEGLDLSHDTPEVHQAVRMGIESMGEIGEIYPIGGAGDRLSLKDENTGELLPAAQLLFCGRTLLEGMVRDVQAREHLHYRLFKKQIVVPLALMTSHEKNNHQRVKAICEHCEWFGRAKESFRFFEQPLVPVVTIEGNWAMHAILNPILKPGGHGLMWKTAIDAGIFDWLEKQGRSRVLVRQINNPVAGVDNGLLALLGIGCGQEKKFGFASCSRLLNTAEGMNVVRKRVIREGEDVAYEYGITNIEYVDFACKGVKDLPVEPGSPFSRFPSNTNILFADLAAVRKAVAVCPIPGMLINMKSKVICQIGDQKEELRAGRLESLMQNIADYIVDKFPKALAKEEFSKLSTFLTYNTRRKTISVTKQTHKKGEPILGTPEGCFYEMLQNYRDLLENFCGMQLPPSESEQEYVENGPAFLTLFNPSIGPLYGVIGKKIRGGRLAQGAELVLEVAEVDLEDLDLDGSLLIEASDILGKKSESGLILYDEFLCGKCVLHRVVIKNKGIDRSAKNVFWKMAVQRKESVCIRLHGNAEFYAADVVLEGEHVFDVPDGYRLEVFDVDGKISTNLTKIKQATWRWEYAFDERGNVSIAKELCGNQNNA